MSLTPLLHELDALLRSAGVDVDALPGGLAQAEIDNLLAETDVVLSDELREWFSWHDGWGQFGCFHRWAPPLAKVIEWTPTVHEINEWPSYRGVELLQDKYGWFAEVTATDEKSRILGLDVFSADHLTVLHDSVSDMVEYWLWMIDQSLAIIRADGIEFYDSFIPPDLAIDR